MTREGMEWLWRIEARLYQHIALKDWSTFYLMALDTIRQIKESTLAYNNDAAFSRMLKA